MKTVAKIVFFLMLFIGHCGWSQKTTTDSLKRVYKSSKIDTAKVNILNQLAAQFKETNVDATFSLAEKALKSATKIHYQLGIADAEFNLGNASIILGNYATAKSHFQKAKTVFSTLLQSDEQNKTFIFGLARCYSSLGVIFSQEGNYYESLDNYKNGLNLYKKINHQKSISKSYNNIGIVYKSRQNNAKALDYFKKAMVIQEKIGEQTLPVTLTNIGVIYFEDNKLTEAFSYYTKAEQLFKRSKTQLVRHFCKIIGAIISLK